MSYADHGENDLQFSFYQINFFKNFLTYIKMSKDPPAKYYENNKERIQKKLVKDMKVFLKMIKKKSNNMVVNDTKIYLNMKKKSLLSIIKNIIK